LTGGEDELGWGVAVALDEKHVAARAIEQGCEDLRGRVGAVLSEDALVGDTSGDIDSGLAGDLTKNLIEAGVAGSDEEGTVGVGDLSVARWELRWGRGW
jgi:hypothetical protein